MYDVMMSDFPYSVNLYFINLRIPKFIHHSPLTTHHSPLTTHHSPLTTHHSPLTI